MFSLISHVNLYSQLGWASGSGEGARAEKGRPHGRDGEADNLPAAPSLRLTTAVALP